VAVIGDRRDHQRFTGARRPNDHVVRLIAILPRFFFLSLSCFPN
jgi:hypothetical protein